MSTVSLKIAEAIRTGEYADDFPARIVRYRNAWGGEAFGVTFAGQDHGRYLVETQYVQEPTIWWQDLRVLVMDGWQDPPDEDEDEDDWAEFDPPDDLDSVDE